MTTDGIGSVGASGTNSLASSMIARGLTALGTTLVTNFAVSMLMAASAPVKGKTCASNPIRPASRRARLLASGSIEPLSDDIALPTHLANGVCSSGDGVADFATSQWSNGGAHVCRARQQAARRGAAVNHPAVTAWRSLRDALIYCCKTPFLCGRIGRVRRVRCQQGCAGYPWCWVVADGWHTRGSRPARAICSAAAYDRGHHGHS